MDIKLSVLVVGLCLLSGCFADDQAGFADGGDGTQGTAGPGLDTDVPAPGTSEVDTDNADDTSSDAGDSTGGLPPESCDLDCGPGGSCEFDELGEPTCACLDGYVAYGLRCLECVPTQGAFDVDVPSVTVSATFMLGDQPFPPSPYENGRIVLRDPATGDEVELGETRYGSGEATVVPGTYELLYGWVLGDSDVPINRGAKLDTVVIPDADAGYELPVEVSVVELSGNFTFNEGTPPTSPYENGSVVLVDSASGDEVPLGETRTGEYRIKVVPGTYEVHYRRNLAEAAAPINNDVPTGEVLVVDDSEAQTFDADVPVVILSGVFTIDGETPPLSAYENGRVALRHTGSGDEITLGYTRDGSYAVPVVAGSYQVIYQRLTGGVEVPVNRAALLDELTVEGEMQTHDVEIATAVVTGVITVDSQVPPADPGDDGLLLLRNLETGDEAPLGNTADGAYSQRVVRGSYDVYYRQETSSGGVPVNTNAFVQSVDIEGGAALDIDVPMVTVSADVTVGGQTPPSSVYDDGLLYLENAATGDSVLLGNTRLAALQRPVVPGTYDLLYVVEAAGPTMPINASSHLSTVEVESTMALAIDIPVAVLQGAITVAGQTPTQSPYDQGALLLHDVETSDVVYLGSTGVGAFARTLTAGTYVLVYQALLTTGLVPANTNAGLVCLELTGPA